MKRLSLLILVFSVAFIVFFVGPPLLSRQFGLYPLMKAGDILDLFTPLVLIPLYWLLYQLGGNGAVSLKESLAFLVSASFWIMGQAMHLAANSIGHLVEGLTASDVLSLTELYDEILSHYLWHFGVIALSALLIYRQQRNAFREAAGPLWPVVLAGVIYGFTYFLIVIEGATAPIGVPFAVLAVMFCLIWGRRKLKTRPVHVFSLVAYLLATVLFLGWGIYWGGLPEFSKVGIIG